MPKLSIIIPAFNAAAHISRCIDSIFSDQCFTIEVIIVNDGSTDNTEAIIKEKQTFHKNIKLYTQPNRGVSAARNLGIKHAKGEYILFVDSDDQLANDWQNIIQPYLTSESGQFVIFHSSIPKINNLAAAICNINTVANLNTVWSKLYLRHIINDYNIKFDEDVINGEDLIFNIEYYFHTKKYKFVAAKIYEYKDNPNSATKKLDEKYIQSDIAFHQKLRSLLKEFEPNLIYLDDISAINAWLAFFDRCSYIKPYPNDKISEFIVKIDQNILNKYKLHKNYFSKYQQILLKYLQNKHYRIVYNIIRLNRKLKHRRKNNG